MKTYQPMMNLYTDPAANASESRLDDLLIFRENAPDMDDKQILNHLLSFYPCKDRAAVAGNLLDAFGSLKNILEARPEQLETVPGIGKKTARLISSFLPVIRTWENRASQAMQRIGNSRDAEIYCKSILLGARNEEFYVICLNAQCQVVGRRRISTGSLSEVSAYPRSIVETALNYNAHSVMLTHNHPGGTCAPSSEDISSTLQIQKILNSLNILVLDHIIVANHNTYSMIQHGDIDYRVRR